LISLCISGVHTWSEKILEENSVRPTPEMTVERVYCHGGKMRIERRNMKRKVLQGLAAGSILLLSYKPDGVEGSFYNRKRKMLPRLLLSI
jgi:hypothetical protein